MLNSLFGGFDDLSVTPVGRTASQDFAATAVLDRSSAELSAYGRLLDQRSQDILVNGSPAEAMRRHLAEQGGYDSTGALNRMITLFDPSRMWSNAVIRALSDASGQPIERLSIRDQKTLGTLGVIERTKLTRPGEGTIKIYDADQPSDVTLETAIPFALMSHSDLGVVIMGSLTEDAFAQVVAMLQSAVDSAYWRCRTVLFLLPENAKDIESGINAMNWAKGLDVRVFTGAMSSAPKVWNLVLNEWQAAENAIKNSATNAPVIDIFDRKVTPPQAVETKSSDAKGTNFGSLSTGFDSGQDLRRAIEVSSNDKPDATLMRRALRALVTNKSIYATAVINVARGTTLGVEGAKTDVSKLALSAAQLLRAYQRAALMQDAYSAGSAFESVSMNTQARTTVLHLLKGYPHLFLMVIADRQSLETERLNQLVAETITRLA